MDSSPITETSSHVKDAPTTHILHGGVLHAARAIWVILAVASLGFFLFSLPYHIIYLSGNLPISLRIALLQYNLSDNFYIGYQVVHELIIVLGFSVTGLIIFKHKSDDLMILTTSLALVTFGVTIVSLESAASPLNSLKLYMPFLELPILIIQGVGLGLMLLVFYIFPDGRYVPRWTRPLSYIWAFWLASWIIFPRTDPSAFTISPTTQFLMRMMMSDTDLIGRGMYLLHSYSLIVVLVLWFGSAVFAQIYRYLKVSTPAQRFQTKWVVFGMTGSVLIYFWARIIPPYFMAAMGEATYSHLIYELVTLPIAAAALLLTPISLSISIRRYRLWDVDLIINRTLVYGALTAFVGLFYLLDVVALQFVFTSLTGNQSTLFITVSTFIIAALFQPLYRWLQGVVDRRFFRDKVNFRQVFTSFAREVRTIIDLKELLRTLVQRTTELFNIEYGAVYLQEPNRSFGLEGSLNVPEGRAEAWHPNKEQIERLTSSQVISQPKDPLYPMLVPLIAPQTSGSPNQNSPLLGILAFGPLRSGVHYSRNDYGLLLSLADQAGTAIYVARLIEESREETRRRMEAEQHLEAYRSSPIGRAEALAQSVMGNPQSAVVGIHQITDQAGKDPESASLIGNLPKVLQNMNAGAIALLAEGYNYIYESQYTPELFNVGLRTLIVSLGTLAQSSGSSTVHDQGGKQGCEQSNEIQRALQVYRVCLDAYDANSTTQIIDTKGLGDRDEEWPTEDRGRTEIIQPLPVTGFLSKLCNTLHELGAVIEALHAYERVDNIQDKLAYLASAVNSLRHVGHLGRTELESADRPIIEHIIANWLAIVTSAMSELQTSARIVAQLLTRNTWQGDIVSLALSVKNMGRGVALQLKVSLAPAPDYTVIDEVAIVERLAPGEEAQVQLRVRPHLTEGMDHFRARFIIRFTDPRGPDQVENFADAVHLLTTSGEFQFIPNPYVVGTPLKIGSPLFFGRQDVVLFIQENLSASHRNNMVLIGQRRTGKTSLLKQLPARLTDDTLPVYLDGQTLGLDPGMANFFLSLATEIAFALEDYGYEIETPELEDFANSPAAVFENQFLERVRQLIGKRHLLIMFDEFEELEAAVRRGHLEPTIFGFLRHLIQHEPNLSVIFCGTHRLEQLASDYWSVLFNISLYQHIAFLQRADAFHLIQEPVKSYGMRYDDLALDKMWRVTAGHPYFLQLLCHSLVNQHNKTQRNYVTIADVNTALEEILASGEAHFVYLWTESTAEERLVLTALSRMIPLTGQASAYQMVDFFDERGISIDRQAIQEALYHLTLRDILQTNLDSDTASGMRSGTGESYRWKLGLLGLWVEKYKSMSRVVDEVTSKEVASKEAALKNEVVAKPNGTENE